MEIRDEDLEVMSWCYAEKPTCKGGQHVAKPCAGVMILHKPSGIAVRECEERSMYRNKHAALSRLQSILNLVYGPSTGSCRYCQAPVAFEHNCCVPCADERGP